MIQAKEPVDFEDWRNQARSFLKDHRTPSEIRWGDGALPGFDFSIPIKPRATSDQRLTVPPEFLELARLISCARIDDRWDFLYRLLYRIAFENANLLQNEIDADVRRARILEKNLRRDIHKMHAFVRFKRIDIDGQDAYVAWHRPEHLVLPLAAPFFARRFGDKPWAIFTPDASIRWDLKNLIPGKGLPLHDFPHRDDVDELWKTYYASIFNPARLNLKVMRQHMPAKYWESLPEAGLIQELAHHASSRLQLMNSNKVQKAVVPHSDHWPDTRVAAASCQACPLFHRATGTVFGEGPLNAKIMIIGEQPGDQEDLQGRPFVGPAGELLSLAMSEAGLDRQNLYLTNAVKHFKWEPGDNGKARIHKRASAQEAEACRPWLDAEIAKIKPQVIIALGVTAGTAIFGKVPRLREDRGQLVTHLSSAPCALLSWHPSAILRATAESKDEMFQQLVADLTVAKSQSEISHSAQKPEALGR